MVGRQWFRNEFFCDLLDQDLVKMSSNPAGPEGITPHTIDGGETERGLREILLKKDLWDQEKLKQDFFPQTHNEANI